MADIQKYLLNKWIDVYSSYYLWFSFLCVSSKKSSFFDATQMPTYTFHSMFSLIYFLPKEKLFYSLNGSVKRKWVTFPTDSGTCWPGCWTAVFPWKTSVFSPHLKKGGWYQLCGGVGVRLSWMNHAEHPLPAWRRQARLTGCAFFSICPEDSKARAGPQAQEPGFLCDSPWTRRDPSRRASSPWQRARRPSPAPGLDSAPQSGFLPWAEQQTRLVPNLSQSPEHAKANLWAATPCFLLNTWRHPSSGQNCFLTRI